MPEYTDYILQDDKTKKFLISGGQEMCNNSITIYGVFHIFISILALFLSFKCNDGFDFWSFIIALFLPYIYIIYIFALKFQCVKSMF